VAPFSSSVTGVLGGLGLDHHDRDLAVVQHAAGDDHVERGPLDLGAGREGDPLAVDQRHSGTSDRAAERQPRDLGGRRGRVDGQHVVGVVRVEREDGDHDLHLVAQALGECRAQRPVDQPAGEDRVLGRTSLTAEERAGDPPGGIHLFLDVDGEREEVEALPRALAGRGGRQKHRVVVEVGHDGTSGLLGQPTGFEADGAGSEGTVVDGRDRGGHTVFGSDV
jgi:hypothetical protein